MSNVQSIFSSAEIKKGTIQVQASLWISKMDRGLSLAEKDDFITWTNQSHLHQETLYNFAALWDDLSVLNELSALFPINNQNKNKNNREAFTSKIAIAASIIFVFILGSNFYSNESLDAKAIRQQYVEIKNISTVVGQQNSFSLSDGSIIQLNTNSLVKINFSQNKRLLTLVRGEARFDVAKDKTRPFTVTSGSNSFTALGTIFNVQKNSNQDMELVVTEGRVLITKASQIIDKIAKKIYQLPEEQLPGLLVTSGEKAIINQNIPKMAKSVSLDQVQKDLAWQQGMLIFEGDSLVDALAEVSRYTAINFEIVDSELANIKIAGYFKAGDIDGLLQSLNSNFNIHFENINKNSIRLTNSVKQ